MRRIAVLALLGLSACATTDPEPRIVTHTVEVPIARACVPTSLAGAPTYPDEDDAIRSAAGPAERYRLLAAGRILRNQRLAELEPVLLACR